MREIIVAISVVNTVSEADHFAFFDQCFAVGFPNQAISIYRANPYPEVTALLWTIHHISIRTSSIVMADATINYLKKSIGGFIAFSPL